MEAATDSRVALATQAQDTQLPDPRLAAAIRVAGVCAGGARRLQHMPGPETKGQGRQSPSDRARLRAAPATLLRNRTWRSQVCKSQPARNFRACFLRRKKALAVYFQTRQRRFARVASRRNAKRQRKAS